MKKKTKQVEWNPMKEQLVVTNMKKTTNKNPIAKYVEKKGTTNELPTYDDVDESVKIYHSWNRIGENSRCNTDRLSWFLLGIVVSYIVVSCIVYFPNLSL